MRKQLDIYSFTVIFYIAMTLIANDLLIPSRLCTIAIGLLVLGTALHLIQKDKFILKKNKYNFFCWYLLFVGISVVAMLYSPDKSILNDSSLFIKITSQIKRFVITFIAYIGSIILLSRVKITSHNYIEWVIYAGIVFLISSIITVAVNYILDKKGTVGALKMLIRK